MSDSQQIDITPYKVRRESAITSNQQKGDEPKPATDLATSILEKLTEIKDNLYPSHLNIPPSKYGQTPHSPYANQNKTSNINIQEFENPTNGLETIFRKDTFVSSIQSKSRENSPITRSPGSPFYIASPINSRIHHVLEHSPEAKLNVEIASAFKEIVSPIGNIVNRSRSNSPLLNDQQITSKPSYPYYQVSNNSVPAAHMGEQYQKRAGSQQYIPQRESPILLSHNSQNHDHVYSSNPGNPAFPTYEKAKSFPTNIQELVGRYSPSQGQYLTTDQNRSPLKVSSHSLSNERTGQSENNFKPSTQLMKAQSHDVFQVGEKNKNLDLIGGQSDVDIVPVFGSYDRKEFSPQIKAEPKNPFIQRASSPGGEPLSGSVEKYEEPFLNTLNQKDLNTLKHSQGKLETKQSEFIGNRESQDYEQRTKARSPQQDSQDNSQKQKVEERLSYNEGTLQNNLNENYKEEGRIPVKSNVLLSNNMNNVFQQQYSQEEAFNHPQNQPNLGYSNAMNIGQGQSLGRNAISQQNNIDANIQPKNLQTTSQNMQRDSSENDHKNVSQQSKPIQSQPYSHENSLTGDDFPKFSNENSPQVYRNSDSQDRKISESQRNHIIEQNPFQNGYGDIQKTSHKQDVGYQSQNVQEIESVFRSSQLNNQNNYDLQRDSNTKLEGQGLIDQRQSPGLINQKAQQERDRSSQPNDSSSQPYFDNREKAIVNQQNLPSNRTSQQRKISSESQRQMEQLQQLEELINENKRKAENDGVYKRRSERFETLKEGNMRIDQQSEGRISREDQKEYAQEQEAYDNRSQHFDSNSNQGEQSVQSYGRRSPNQYQEPQYKSHNDNKNQNRTNQQREGRIIKNKHEQETFGNLNEHLDQNTKQGQFNQLKGREISNQHPNPQYNNNNQNRSNQPESQERIYQQQQKDFEHDQEIFENENQVFDQNISQGHSLQSRGSGVQKQYNNTQYGNQLNIDQQWKEESPNSEGTKGRNLTRNQSLKSQGSDIQSQPQAAQSRNYNQEKANSQQTQDRVPRNQDEAFEHEQDALEYQNPNSKQNSNQGQINKPQPGEGRDFKNQSHSAQINNSQNKTNHQQTRRGSGKQYDDFEYEENVFRNQDEEVNEDFNQGQFVQSKGRGTPNQYQNPRYNNSNPNRPNQSEPQERVYREQPRDYEQESEENFENRNQSSNFNNNPDRLVKTHNEGREIENQYQNLHQSNSQERIKQQRDEAKSNERLRSRQGYDSSNNRIEERHFNEEQFLSQQEREKKVDQNQYQNSQSSDNQKVVNKATREQSHGSDQRQGISKNKDQVFNKNHQQETPPNSQEINLQNENQVSQVRSNTSNSISGSQNYPVKQYQNENRIKQSSSVEVKDDEDFTEYTQSKDESSSERRQLEGLQSEESRGQNQPKEKKSLAEKVIVNQAMDKRFSFGLINPEITEIENENQTFNQEVNQTKNHEMQRKTNPQGKGEVSKKQSKFSNVPRDEENPHLQAQSFPVNQVKEGSPHDNNQGDIAIPVDSNESKFTFIKGDESIQNNPVSNRTQNVSSPVKSETAEEIILIKQDKEGDKQQNRKSSNTSASPPKRRQASEVPSQQITSYITLEHERQDRRTKTQPGSMKNIDERPSRWSKNEGEIKSASTNSQNEQRTKTESATRVNEPTSSTANIRMSRLSPPSISIQGSAPHLLNFRGSNFTSPTHSMNPTNPMMNMGNNFGMGNPNMFPFNSPQQMMLNFPLPNFENNSNAADYQKYILMIINYYESHLNNMKNIITQQNEALNHERHINQVLEMRNVELVNRIQELDKLVKEQSSQYDANQKELKTRYEVVLDELAALRKTLASKQINEDVHSATKVTFDKGPEGHNLLYHEILSLRKDLENQRQSMYDFRSSTRHLESQIKDLERTYIDELKTNAHFNQKHQQINEALDKYKTDYIKMDTLNKIILEGYERTRKDLEEIKSSTFIDEQPVIETFDKDPNQTQGSAYPNQRSRVPSIGFNPDLEDRNKAKREIFIRSISPLRNDNEGNKEEMLKNKMRAQDSQIKELLQWNNNNNNNKSPTNPVVYTPSYTQSMGPIHLNAPHQNIQESKTSTSSIQYSHKKGNSMQGNVQSPNPRRLPQTESKPNRPNVTFPSYQRIEDNKDEIMRTDQTLVQLTQTRKIVENELFKMPSVAKSLEQKRKKASLEMELEGIDYQIEECKNKLRKYDVLNIKN